MKHSRGFTLIEMLVSMVLLMMVMLIASGAYSLFSERWNGRLGHYNKSLTTAKQSILVQEALSGIIAYAITDDNGVEGLYFEGNRNGFVAVTLRSIFNPEIAAVVRLQVTQNDDFTYKLTYEESAMTEQLLLNAKQPIIFSPAIVLFDKFHEINFEYFGWSTLASKISAFDVVDLLTEKETQEWFSEYNSLEKNIQPEQIKVTFTSTQGEFTLHQKLLSAAPSLLNNYSENF